MPPKQVIDTTETISPGDASLSELLPSSGETSESIHKLFDPILSGSSPSYAARAGLESTVSGNVSAFTTYSIVPRMLRPVLPQRDLSRTVFGRKLPAPIVMAPVGVQKLLHSDGELGTAKVFGEMGLPYTMSTASSTGMEDVARANGAGNPRWYQLYWPSDDKLTCSYLNRAKASGYEILVVTVDTWELAWRPRDLESGFFPFIDGLGTTLGLEDPVAQRQLGFDATQKRATKEQKQMAKLYHVVSTSRGVSPRWENLHKLRAWWGKGPIVLKGIQSVHDAKLALEHGMDGIIVSNHGGRQVDGAIASLDALGPIVDAVGGQLTIGFDSGIRCGADMFKALAMGADFVQLGRPILWGLALNGEEGVRHVLKCLLAEFDLTVGLSGCTGLSDISRDILATRCSSSMRSML
ncbi:putative lactate 2-monooxygenase [Lachnellula willkommii]|uniref:Putative lactate 2-monooxygenase n=1 Tax=Lachnellula willkommii TaxID=215461 RepID=A0A559MKW3_9HELO|nr:putative lactate 2-monooxygenase [Lachnellula willkommii]